MFLRVGGHCWRHIPDQHLLTKSRLAISPPLSALDGGQVSRVQYSPTSIKRISFYYELIPNPRLETSVGWMTVSIFCITDFVHAVKLLYNVQSSLQKQQFFGVKLGRFRVPQNITRGPKRGTRSIGWEPLFYKTTGIGKKNNASKCWLMWADYNEPLSITVLFHIPV